MPILLDHRDEIAARAKLKERGFAFARKLISVDPSQRWWIAAPNSYSLARHLDTLDLRNAYYYLTERLGTISGTSKYLLTGIATAQNIHLRTDKFKEIDMLDAKTT